MKKSLVVMLLVLTSAVLVQQSLAQAAGQAAPVGGQQSAQSKGPEIKDPAEYNAYINAFNQQNPAQKAQALEAFLQTYPNSVMKEQALEILMAAYQQAGDSQKALDTAVRVLQVNPNNIRALALLAYTYRAMGMQGGPQMQANLAKAQQYGQQGLQALQNMKKPDGMSDADFTKLHNETGSIFDGAVGFAALQAKDYATAQKDLQEAVADESQPNIADLYPLATADLEAKPVNPAGFWFIVKAANLAEGAAQQQILTYGKNKYIHYHGSDEGWDNVVNQVKASPSVMPPQDFNVAAAPPPPPLTQQAADLVAKKGPTKMDFGEWQLVLSSGNQQAADTVWNAIKDKIAPLGAQVITASATKITLAGSSDDITTNTPDITLTMDKPLPTRLIPQVGKLMYFKGAVSSYTPNPFMMNITDGVLLDANGKVVPITPPVHHTTTHKSQ
jgi:hypothetical protein